MMKIIKILSILFLVLFGYIKLDIVVCYRAEYTPNREYNIRLYLQTPMIFLFRSMIKKESIVM
jgi:hypothetical protein